MSAHKPSYTPLPAIPPELRPRLLVILQVLDGAMSVTAGAQALGLSRNHFQTLLHRGVAGLIEAIGAKSAGRRPRGPVVKGLQGEIERLERENAKLRQRVETTDRLLEVAGGLLHGRISPGRREARARKASGVSGERAEEPEPAHAAILAALEELRVLGLNRTQGAVLSGCHPATLRRWRAHAVRGVACAARARRPPIPAVIEHEAEQLVRRLHGLIGADALAHRICGLSRRAAAAVKSRTLGLMEQERKATAMRITVLHPGVLRGIDAMHLRAREERCYALICADGAVPYRTSQLVGPRYDDGYVARALARDFERHGAPLVLRLDRASAHRTPKVRELLADHGVLVLHGPPHYPRFYGQLERQNRDHRAWLGSLESLSMGQLDAYLEDMLNTLNRDWPRRSLGWHTPSELWEHRPALDIDRSVLRKEVDSRATCIARTLDQRHQNVDLAERLAIEQTLEHMGYLRQEIGGWC